jgi:hypothetical protein
MDWRRENRNWLVKMMSILGLGLMLAWCDHAMARIGQTEEQVEALFGKSIDTGTANQNGVTTNLYKTPSGEYLAAVQFLKGHSISESYARADSRELSEREISVFLQGNSAGKEWNKDPKKLAWERSDHHAKAWCEVIGDRSTLVVELK